MPIETIKCQECGSADVTEFKAGSYVCGHCEAVFKYSKPANVGASECSCGRVPIGHCSECGDSVCGVHSQDWRGSLLCMPHWQPRNDAWVKDENEKVREQRRQASENFLTPEKFVALAAARGNPGLQSWTIETEYAQVIRKVRRGSFKRSFTYEDEVCVSSFVISGWTVLGNLRDLLLITDDARVHKIQQGWGGKSTIPRNNIGLGVSAAPAIVGPRSRWVEDSFSRGGERKVPFSEGAELDEFWRNGEVDRVLRELLNDLHNREVNGEVALQRQKEFWQRQDSVE